VAEKRQQYVLDARTDAKELSVSLEQPARNVRDSAKPVGKQGLDE
jgi:hypothetical protein